MGQQRTRAPLTGIGSYGKPVEPSAPVPNQPQGTQPTPYTPPPPQQPSLGALSELVRSQRAQPSEPEYALQGPLEPEQPGEGFALEQTLSPQQRQLLLNLRAALLSP